MISMVADLAFGTGAPGNAALRQGWLPPEQGFVWSTGVSSSLVLPAPPTPAGVLLELMVAPFVYAPALSRQGLGVSVNGVEIGRRDFAGEWRWQLTVPPEAVAGSATLHVTFHHPDAASPESVGHSPDGRVLAFQLVRIVLLHDPALADLPAPCGRLKLAGRFRFGINETTAALLGEGWHTPACGYVGSRSRRAALHLPPPGAGDYTIILDIATNAPPEAAPPEQPAQRIAVGAGGRLIDYVDISKRTAVGIRLPVMGGNDNIDITFDVFDAGGATAQAPAFRLHQLTLLRSDLPLPSAASRLWPALPPRVGGGLEQNLHESLGATIAELLTQAESLGNVCDLGILQRAFGYEPAGLLRFSGIGTPLLVDGILRGFPGLGRGDSLEILVRHDDEQGYWVIDHEYSLALQTPVSAAIVSESGLKRQLARNLPFLRRKFLADIVASERIFVFQRRDPTCRPEAEAVLAALAYWGDPVLLWTCNDPDQSPGSVELLGPRLLRGYLGAPQGKYGYPTADAWLSVLGNAVAAARLLRKA